MKRAAKKIIVMTMMLEMMVFLLLFHDSMSYSTKIGNASFFLVETMAMSDDGKLLRDLCYKYGFTDGYSGVEMSGYLHSIL